MLRLLLCLLVCLLLLPGGARAQTAAVPPNQPKAASATTSTTNPAPNAQLTAAPPPPTPTRAAVLAGAYGPWRANNDLLFYRLHVRVDPEAKSIAGSSMARFRMVEAGSRIQLDLTPALAVDGVTLAEKPLHYTREDGAILIDLPRPYRRGEVAEVTVRYSGHPVSKGRFGGMSYERDPAVRPWIFTACEDDGSSVWWPSKDQWRDEPQDGMEIAVAVPDALSAVSNGRLQGTHALGDGYTEWRWRVSYPINSYDVALNIGAYQHFAEVYRNPAFAPLTLDFYALPEDLDKARAQFAQARGMLDAFEHYLGEYPFARDGYKLVEVPYAGMEHQSAVAYGNGFHNGYLNRDWTGVGISPRFDFIIIHESGHEWFGNAVSGADRADMWLHEAWTTYLEMLFVEFHYGKADALRYATGFVPKVRNREPIVSEPGANADPPQDQYFKGALMIGTLRSWLATLAPDEAAADRRWFGLVRAFYERFRYRTTTTEEATAWWSGATGLDLRAFFNQYLRRTEVPCLELSFDSAAHAVLYKWQAAEPGFSMPVEVGEPGHWQTLHPTRAWQVLPTPLTPEQFAVRTDHFFINVSKT